MSTNCNANNDLSHYKKPYFSIEFTAKRLGVNIYLNDIPIFNIKNTGFMTLEVPVNEYIINGNNEIKAITFPLFNDDDEQNDEYIDGASIDIGLYIREDDAPTEKKQLISKVSITPNNAYLNSPTEQIAIFVDSKENSTPISTNKEATILNYPTYGNYKKQVVSKWNINNLKSSLPHWQWQDGELIKNNEDTYKSLLKAYKELHDAFSRKDLAMVKKISLPRSKEFSSAYYLTNTEAGFERSALGKDIDHPSIKLYEKLATDVSTLEVFASGKLARIIDGADIHPILFIDDDSGQFYQHQFKWQKNNNEWVLIR